MTDQQTEQIERALSVQGLLGLSFSPFETIEMLEEVRTALDHDPDEARAKMDRLTKVLRIAAGFQTTDLARGGLAPWQKRKIEAHIDERLGYPMPVKTLADLVLLSSGHFGRAFKETFGSTPHAYIVRRRISRAKELMLTGREPLGQIALSCGFADQAHFTTLFRRLIGQPPGDWRRANATL